MRDLNICFLVSSDHFDSVLFFLILMGDRDFNLYFLIKESKLLWFTKYNNFDNLFLCIIYSFRLNSDIQLH